MSTALDQPGPCDAQGPLANAPTGFARIRALYGRIEHLVHEVGKFGIVGGIAFGVDTAIFAALNGHEVLGHRCEPLTAKTIAALLSATIAFIGNRYWTWAHRERNSLAREYSLYFGLNAIGLAMALVILAASHYGLGAIWPHIFHTYAADLISANLIGTGAGTLFRFWSYRRYVFPPAETSQVGRSVADRR